MRTLSEILLDSEEAMDRLLREAFAAGEDHGYHKAMVAMQTFLSAAASGEPATPSLIGSGTSDDPISASDGRAAPGSVKPAILNVIRQSPGITLADIQTRTGAKPNSVRGTLWTLQKEGLIVRLGDGYSAPVIPIPNTTLTEDTEFRTDDNPSNTQVYSPA